MVERARSFLLCSTIVSVACSTPPQAPAPKSKPRAESGTVAEAKAEPVAPAEVEAPPAAESTAGADWPIPKPELSQAPAGEETVTLIEPGAEPHEALRFSPRAGQARTVALSMQMQVAMTLGDKPIDPSVLPAVNVEMQVKPGPAKEGVSPFAFEVLSASRESLDSASERLKKAMDTAVEGMKDSKGSFSFDAQGRRAAADYGLPEVPTPGLRPSLAGFQQSFSQLFVVFPEQAVGVGAKWSSTSHFELSGIPIEQRATYTLESRDADTVRLAVSFEQSATGEAAAPSGVALEDTRFGGRGSGSLSVRLDSPFPIEAQAQSRSRVQSSVTMGGQAQPVEMDLLSTLSIAAPPA